MCQTVSFTVNYSQTILKMHFDVLHSYNTFSILYFFFLPATVRQWYRILVHGMLFTLKEIVKWFGMTAFEIWLHLLSLLIFTIVAALKYENVIHATWWHVFIPLFTADGLCTYFCLIVFIRMLQEPDCRQALMRVFSSLLMIILIFVFKFFLCQKLSGHSELRFSEILAPAFIFLVVLFVKACRVHWDHGRIQSWEAVS